MMTRTTLVLVLTLLVAACDLSEVPEQQTEGPNPTIPPPSKALVTTVNLARAIGWPEGATPKAADGLAVKAFASGLDHPRWLYVLPNGDVLVAETNTPQAGSGPGGIKGWIMAWAMRRGRRRRAEPQSHHAAARRRRRRRGRDQRACSSRA